MNHLEGRLIGVLNSEVRLIISPSVSGYCMVSNNMTAKMMRRTREQDVEKVRKSDGRYER